MDKDQISQIFANMAVMLEIKGENPFKVRAYENAVRVLEGMKDFEERVKSDTLTEVKGIGENLSKHIAELYNTDRMKEYEKLRKSIPEGLFEIMAIPGIGAKTVKFLYEKLEIKSIGALELTCKHGGLRKYPGYGQKTEEKILRGIAYLRRHIGQHLYSDALAAAMEIFRKIEKNKDVIRAELAGSLRRKKETIKDIDIVVSTKRPESVINFFTKMNEVEKVEAKGETKTTVVLSSGISADLRTVSDKEFPYALHHFTGSKEHNVAMRSRAQKMGYKMNEYGLYKISGKKDVLVRCENEGDIFSELKLDYIEPELRENMGEISAAEEGKLPKLLDPKEMKGVLHVHSDYSDGVSSIEEMAVAAKKMGYSYIGICDHSQSVTYAGGMSIESVKKQWKEINSLNKKLRGIKVLKGIECDILGDGALDYPEKMLNGFDFVIAAVHSRFSMSEDEMTRRIIKAVENPHVHILAHPTGRLLLTREHYKVNMHKVIDAAAENDVAIEINSNPHRLDLDWRLCPYAKSKGVKIAICPDAHSVENLEDIYYGIGIARKGWLTKEDILNTLTLKEIEGWFS